MRGETCRYNVVIIIQHCAVVVLKTASWWAPDRRALPLPPFRPLRPLRPGTHSSGAG